MTSKQYADNLAKQVKHNSTIVERALSSGLLSDDEFASILKNYDNIINKIAQTISDKADNNEQKMKEILDESMGSYYANYFLQRLKEAKAAN